MEIPRITGSQWLELLNMCEEEYRGKNLKNAVIKASDKIIILCFSYQFIWIQQDIIHESRRFKIGCTGC